LGKPWLVRENSFVQYINLEFIQVIGTQFNVREGEMMEQKRINESEYNMAEA